MREPTLGNPQNTIEVLKKYEFVFQKKYGQNFLIDPRVLEKIIQSAGITEEDFVLEIGPGIGTMTQYLAQASRKVTAIEIDKMLLPILKETLEGFDNVEIIHNDVLKGRSERGWQRRKKRGGAPLKVVAKTCLTILRHPSSCACLKSHVPVKEHKP